MSNGTIKTFNIKDFKSNKNYVIEASAGTGKTYSIVKIVEKLLQENKNLSLEQILIVTYTEKAAGELKDRIRSAIAGANTDNAPISTFHSFCKSTIEEFPFAVKKPSLLTLVDVPVMVEFAKQYIRKGQISVEITSYIEYLQSLDKKFDEETFVKSLVDSCGKYYLTNSGDEDPAIITLEKPQVLFGYCTANSLSEMIDVNPEIGIHLAVLEDSGDPKSIQLAEELKQNYKTFKFNGKSYSISLAWPKTQEEKDALNFFKDLKNLLKVDSKTHPAFDKAIIAMHLAEFYQEWQKEKEKNDFQTFDDMINGVREAVLENDSKLLVKLRDKYLYAIIDEFQDTNQKQFDIFSKVFLCEGHNIIVVGDPKQSIYSFQGADVNVYKKATSIIVANGGERCRLGKNYRSTKGMVSSCNELFKVEDEWFDDFEKSEYLEDAKDGMEFDVTFDDQPVKAFWISDDSAISQYKYARLVTQKIVECCTILSKDKTGKTTKTRLMIKPKDQKTFRPVSFKDFTVLAKVRTEMGPIEKALTKAGIPFVRYKDTGLFKDSECAHWISLLQAINEPDFTGERRKVFKRALFTDFFGLSLYDINKKKYNTDQIKEVELFNRWRNIIHRKKYDALIDDILVNSGIVERMTNLNNIQKLNKYRQIGDYCSDYLTKNHSLPGLINNLTNLFEGGSNDDDSEDGSIVEKGTDFDCVQIMTIHASKGLQFPIVISIAGFKDYKSGSPNYIYHDPNNNDRPTLVLEPNDYTSKERDAEMVRLLYVAYTRAQYVMMLPQYFTSDKKPLEKFIRVKTSKYVSQFPNNFLPIKDNQKSFEVLSEEVKDILPKETADIKGREEQDKKLIELIDKKKKVSSYKHSYSNLSHPSSNLEDEYDEDSGTIFDKEGQESEGLKQFDENGLQIEVNYTDIDPIAIPSKFPKGTEVGSALHEVFEKINFVSYTEDELVSLIKERFVANKLPLDDSFIECIKKMVENVLNADLPEIHGNHATGESFKLSSVCDECKKPEIEFNTNLENEKLKNYFNGFIDLLFVREGEYYSVLDWKSDSLNERDFPNYKTASSLKDHTANAYSIQRVLYCYFLIEWLTLKYGNDRAAIFNEHFGGIYYVYLRGCTKDTFNGIYSQTWKDYATLKAAYENIVKKCINNGGNK